MNERSLATIKDSALVDDFFNNDMNEHSLMFYNKEELEMQRDPLKRESSISLLSVISWFSGAGFVALGGYSMYLGIDEVPGLASLVGSIFGYFIVCYGVSHLLEPVEEADVSQHDPRKEAEEHLLGAVLFL